MKLVKMPGALMAAFLWIGFVGAISFLEAWLKFRAPGITIPLGLGIGRLVFNALNKIEWVFALAIIINMFLLKKEGLNRQKLLFVVPLFILVIQTVWLLPALDARALLFIKGEAVPSSNLHLSYICLEVMKVFCLLIFGLKQFNTQ